MPRDSYDTFLIIDSEIEAKFDQALKSSRHNSNPDKQKKISSKSPQGVEFYVNPAESGKKTKHSSEKGHVFIVHAKKPRDKRFHKYEMVYYKDCIMPFGRYGKVSFDKRTDIIDAIASLLDLTLLGVMPTPSKKLNRTNSTRRQTQVVKDRKKVSHRGERPRTETSPSDKKPPKRNGTATHLKDSSKRSSSRVGVEATPKAKKPSKYGHATVGLKNPSESTYTEATPKGKRPSKYGHATVGLKNPNESIYTEATPKGKRPIKYGHATVGLKNPNESIYTDATPKGKRPSITATGSTRSRYGHFTIEPGRRDSKLVTFFNNLLPARLSVHFQESESAEDYIESNDMSPREADMLHIILTDLILPGIKTVERLSHQEEDGTHTVRIRINNARHIYAFQNLLLCEKSLAFRNLPQFLGPISDAEITEHFCKLESTRPVTSEDFFVRVSSDNFGSKGVYYTVCFKSNLTENVDRIKYRVSTEGKLFVHTSSSDEKEIHDLSSGLKNIILSHIKNYLNNKTKEQLTDFSAARFECPSIGF